MQIGHSLLHGLGLPGFALPAFTSGELGALGGLLLALPILSLRSVPQDLSDFFQAPFQFTFFSAIVVIGGLQGYVGAKMLKGSRFILDVACATVAGATGAFMLVGSFSLLLAVIMFFGERAYQRELREYELREEEL